MDDVTGKGIERVDARAKVTGKADYAADTEVAHVAHGVIVTSAIAKGRVARLDTRAAQAEPGVLAVISHVNATKLPGAGEKNAPQDRLLQVFQSDAILYGDQPIALVVADTLERARSAALLVEARYENDASSIDLEKAASHAYAPAKAGLAETDYHRGDATAGLANAHAKISATYTTPVQNHNPMEPHCTIALWQGDDHLTLYDSTQGIFGVKKKIATLFGLPKDNVRVISHYVGGGFGCKGSTWSHVAIAALGAKIVKRPVKVMISRQQMFSLVGHRPQTRQSVALGADTTGKLVAMTHDVTSETSSFDEFVETAGLAARMLYACPNVRSTHRLVRLDVPTPTFMRAPGESTGTFALECAVDELAHALGMDPIALRLANHADVDPENGKPWSSKSLRECYRRGAEVFGWGRRTATPKSMIDGRFLVGMGMATSVYPARQWPASAIARMRHDGTALVQSGTQDIGTGTYTIMTQIAADALSLPVEKVRFELGDTTFPEAPVSGGSTTAASAGSAVKLACDELVKTLAHAASASESSPLHGTPPNEIVASGGALVSKTDPTKTDSFAAVVGRGGQREVTAQSTTPPNEDRKRLSTYAFGAQFAEVRVDPDLGVVRLTRMVGAFAAGKILNAKTARSQLMGGMVWAAGFTLFEHTVRDPVTGRVATRDLADYHVPVSLDIPAIEVVTIDEADPHVSDVGAKGLGEIGITGGAAAIANAIFHATGVRVRDLPITMEKVLGLTSS
jgi:xanthine dehydrogenase YagR molybdenum-binding subunit